MLIRTWEGIFIYFASGVERENYFLEFFMIYNYIN